MIYASVDVHWDSAHQLKLPYESKCNELHGHRWQIKVYLVAQEANENGMVVDFKIVKNILGEYDHCFLNKKEPFNTVMPTAENIAAQVAQILQVKLDAEMNTPVCYKVEVWETPDNMATWELDTGGGE